MSAAEHRIETRISPDLLDTIGRSFRFRHGKGIAEWLKNALDQYLRLKSQGVESLDGGWPVLLNMIDRPGKTDGPNLVLIDFGGTTFEAVDRFFLHWGDTSAATLGGAAPTSVTGGHGNGGKFYMREMWRGGARFATFRDGRFTSLVVQRARDGSTGRWEAKNIPFQWREALGEALSEANGLDGASWAIEHLSSQLPGIESDLDTGRRGFTVVAGMKAQQVLSTNDVVRGGRWDHQKLLDEVRRARQAARPIRELAISVFVNGSLQIERLSPEEIIPDPSWSPQILDVPATLLSAVNERQDVPRAGVLVIEKSVSELLGPHRDLNSVFVYDGSQNPIASYLVTELPIPGSSPFLRFLKCELSLDFPSLKDLIQNDREKLTDSETTSRLLEWTAHALWAFAQADEERLREQQKSQQLRAAAVLNEALNDHAKRFLEKLQSEILVDFVEDPTGGGLGSKGSGRSPSGEGNAGTGDRNRGAGGSEGEGGTRDSPGQTERQRKPRFPQILLSGYDHDPSRPEGESKVLSERHPPLHQDDTDRSFNIWWINTAHPFARAALAHGGPKGPPFKAHQLSMFRDVVQMEALRVVHRRERELALDTVENELTTVANRFLAELPVDLIADILE